MARKVIDIGTVGNDGTGDSIRDSFRKVNDNFRELYSSLGLGERLTFIGLEDTPLSYIGQNDTGTGATPVLTINNTESGIQFKHLIGGSGVTLDFTTNENEIIINSEFSEISGDTSPQLGGDLSARSGGEQYRILDLGTDSSPLSPLYPHEAVNKAYADSKIARAGTNAVDPATGVANSAFGTMTGPLILARDPVPDDDEIYDGMIAATKRYVDNSAFGSVSNLYVALSGQDERVGVSPDLQGRALAYAYRTLEAALKRAEEIMLDSRKEIGPYKKTLTYNEGAGTCYLSDIDVAPSSGSGFSGQVLMSVDTITTNSPGVNYKVGDILTIDSGTYVEPARYEVLAVNSLPGSDRGPIISIRQLSSGVYTALPGSTAVTVNSDSDFGSGFTVDLTYKVNNAEVLDGGSGYGLVSVRIVGGGGTGAFGTADVVGGIVQSITITDGGSGFTSLPNVVVNLPRFLIYTAGYRTDFTGDVTTSTAAAIRGRDIREGLYLRGETSNALAQILAHRGELDSDGNEIFDVDILYGSFEIGEEISYGDQVLQTQITVLVETGIYEENLPLRVPPNVSIVGDEFRRCIIRPKPGVSSSPWAFIHFRRDPIINELQVADQLYGYHYLTDSTQPVYPLVDNKGYYRSAAELLRLNRSFLQQQIVLWINDQIENEISPFNGTFEYDNTLCGRDVGLILDSMIFDLKWGGADRTISSALKYYSNASGRKAITTQLSQTIAAIRRLNDLAQLIIKNIEITEVYEGAFPQIIDGAYIAEVGAGGTSVNISGITNANPVIISTTGEHGLTTGDVVVIGGVEGTTEINGRDWYVTVTSSTSFTVHDLSDRSDQTDSTDWGTYVSGGTVTEPRGVIGALIDAIIDVIDGSGSVNYPKDNDQMDMFLCNDAGRFQALTFQGHGGFAMVLDPTGQILSRSPYAQECASFSKSTGVHRFAGGQFIDGFAGNLRFIILEKDSDTYLRVGGLKRMPNVPCSFIVNDTIYRINYIRDWTFSTEGSTCSFILDETTPWTEDLFTYNEDICYRDAGLIIDGLGYDIVLGTNFNARRNALTYRQAQAAVVINDQLDLTVRAIEETHNIASELLTGYSSAQLTAITSNSAYSAIIENGSTFAPTISFTNPTGVDANVASAKSQLINNIPFIVDEVTSWINWNISNVGTIWNGFTYSDTTCQRDVQYIVDAIRYDMVFNTNYQSISNALRYLSGSAATVLSSQKEQTLQGLLKAREYTIAELSDSTAISRASALWDIIIDIIRDEGGAPSYSLTVPTGGSNNASDTGYLYARQQIQANKTFIRAEVIAWINVQIAGDIAPFTSAYTYDSTACSRDVGLILDALIYDLNYGGNLQTYDAALAYYVGAVAQYGTGEKDEVIAALGRLKTVVGEVILETAVSVSAGNTETQDVSGSAGSAGAATAAEGRIQSIADYLTSDGATPPAITTPDITWASSTLQSEFAALDSTAQTAIAVATTDWLDNQIATLGTLFTTPFSYNEVKCARDVRYIVEGIVYDVLYGGNSATRYSALRYWDGLGDTVVSQLGTGEEDETTAAINYASYLAQLVVLNLDPAATYSSTSRVAGTAATYDEAATISSLMTIITDVINGGVGSAPTEVLPDLTGYSASLTEAKDILDAARTTIQEGTIAFVNDNANWYEVLMPGNRSMLGNDYTQINDMGYGVIVTNGGLCEAVSMFSYYCYVSMYSLNGGQIRSVMSSSAHGVYALVADGADPLEIPTPVTLYYDLAQGAECYNDGATYTNTVNGLQLYVTNYSYVPLNNAELEVDHGYSIYRYPVTSVSTDDLPAGVAKLNLGSAEGAAADGLAFAIPDGTPLTIRQNSQIVLTGDVVEVATRPSTGLVLRESSDVYRILQFEAYVDPVGARTCTISIADPAVITLAGHGLQPGFLISFTTTGNLPTGLNTADFYYVISDDWSTNSFQVSTTKNGLPVETSGTQSGIHSVTVEGLARTTLRENYNYVDLTVWPQQPFDRTSTCTLTIGDPCEITWAGHGLSVNDVVRFETTGSLPSGVSITRMYFVESVVDVDTFTIKSTVGGDPIATTGSQSGVHTVGQVIGNVGDTTFAVVPVGPEDEARILGTKIVWIGQEYTLVSYDNESTTGKPYALVTVSPALQDSVVLYDSLPTLKSAVGVNEPGTLTIRISLTRVTGHDLLEIGTGSYADTNYPNEIYGPAVNALDPAAETEERGVGRCFYVTTDQFGNFNVGPYFRVDQGTGRVTFSAAIALSNLDGIGFKRGVPIAEFSTDSAFSDNATDTVPTENATRSYIERRLGISHTGAIIPEESVIPAFTGGYMSLDGQLAMKNDMNLDGNKIIFLADPVDGTDAVNLRSMTFANLQEFQIDNLAANDIIVFTGDGNTAINCSVVGDISLSIDSTANTIDAQINPDTILNSDINSAAGIVQSKLSMTLAATSASAPTGTAAAKQAASGLSSFDEAQFNVTDGWVTLKNNGTPLSRLPQIGPDTVLGNSGASTADVTSVTFATVVNEGLAIKKSNYTTTGYLRRKNSISAAGDTGSGIGDSYEMVEESSINAASTLVKRDSNGDFAGRVISAEQYKLDTKMLADTTTSGGGGVIQLYGYLGQASILLGDGSLSTDKRNYYDNEGHIFRPQNGVGYAPITASSIQVTTLTTGGSSTAGTITGNWSLSTGSKMQATYADLAEYYSSDKEYQPGTVVIFGGDAEVTISNTANDTKVAGVVTTDPAYVMNSELSGTRVCLALQGRVPCRVVGKIKKGDILVTSRIAGVAVAATGDVKVGTMIGKALQPYDSDNIGTIEVAVGRT